MTFTETEGTSEVAAAAHVSVRTLHHYDEIGLLPPARRTDAGYRLYGPAVLRAVDRAIEVLECSGSPR